MNRSISVLGRPLSLTAATALMFTLVACSGPDEAATTPSPASRVSVSESPAASTPTPSEPASQSASASASPTAGSEAGNDTLLAAGRLAEKEVSRSTVVSIETERDGYEVNVVSADGDEQRLRTNAAGTKLVSGPTDDRPDAEDRAENREFAKVDVDYKRAVKALEDETDGGTINELNLDHENRRSGWEADVSVGAQQRSVQIDAANGRVVSNWADD
jgi:uncharacterized membrane protein YkoI